MPQVPYSGVPSVEPQFQPTPRYSANTPEAAFGGATAQALTHLGSSFGEVGNELFARAQAMQDLANHSEAQEASSKYMEQAGKLHADYSALQGKDAVNGYNPYVQSLRDARISIRDGLSNPMVQKMYDADSRSFEARSIFNGAGHAATENKQYAIGAATARVQSSRNAALVDPTDEAGFQAHVTDTIRNTTAQWQLKGADQDTIDSANHKAVSDLWYDRIAGLARSQPFTASKLLDRATADGKIQGEDIGKLTSIVRDATHTVGARNISNEVRSGSDLSWGAKPVSIGDAKFAIGTFESGNNYQSVGVQTAHGKALGRYQVMEDFLPEFLQKAGLPSMTPKEFLNSASAQDKVFESVFGGYMKDKGSFNDAASMWFSGKPAAQAGNVKDANGTTVPGYLTATNAILAKNAGLPDQVSAGRSAADKLSPNDPLLADYAEQRIIADHNQQLAAKRDFDYKNRQAVEGGLIGGDKGGRLPTSVDDLKAQGPEVEAAWQQLPDADKRRYMSVMARNAKGDVVMTEDRLREYQRLKGLSFNDPGAFLDTDVIGADLPMSTRKELVNLQQQTLKNAAQDPRVLHALSLLKPMMDQAQIDRKSDAQGYDRFVGTLQDQLQDYANVAKKPADAKAIQEIGQRLLQQHVTSSGFFWDSKSPVYNLEVPDAERTKILADPYWKDRGVVPTDDMIQRIFVRQMYNQLYSKPTKAQSAAEAPMSK